MLYRLWHDEAGAVLSAEIVLVATILVIGMIVGLKSVRDSVVTELADVAQAIANIDQSYRYSAVRGHAANTAGGLYIDVRDFCDGPPATDRAPSKCVDVAVDGRPEGSVGRN